MKKILAFLFVAAFGVAVVSCGQKSEDKTTASDSVTVSEPAPADAANDSTTVAPAGDTTVTAK